MFSKQATRTVCALAVSISAAGCGEPAAAPLFTVRDSAGVEIRESHGPAWTAGEGWRLGEEPLLTIGGRDGGEGETLFGAGSAVRLEDGRIVVANRGTGEVRWYDPSGTLTAVRGGRGGGPGEFLELASVHALPGDSVAAYDFRAGRMVVYDSAAAPARTIRLQRPTTAPLRIPSFLGDGRIVAVAPGASARADTTVAGRVTRDSVPVLVFAPDGALADTLRMAPGAETFMSRSLGQPFVTSPPFHRETVVTADGETTWVGTAEAFQVDGYGSDGALNRIVRVVGPDSVVTPADVEAFREEVLGFLPAAAEEQRAQFRSVLEEMPAPATHPPYARMLTDAAGNLWLGSWSLPVLEPTLWRIFDAEGRYLGGMALPPRTKLLEVGEDWVLLRTQDELDTERIELRSLLKE